MRVIVLLVSASTIAFAQAPSSPLPPYQPAQPASSTTTTPQPAPAPVDPYQPALPPPPRPPPPTVMDKRWAVGLALGGERLTVNGGDQATVPFTIIELAARLRVIPMLEFGMTLHGGGAQTPSGDLSDAGFYFDARYRFLAARPWNVYLTGSLGFRALAGKDASATDKKIRGSLRVGVGGERRWSWFAIDAELDLQAIGENLDVSEVSPPTSRYEVARFGLTGAMLLLGVTAYF